MARALLALLRGLEIPVSDAQRAYVLAQTNAPLLLRWVEELALTGSLAEVLDEGEVFVSIDAWKKSLVWSSLDEARARGEAKGAARVAILLSESALTNMS